MSEEQPIDVWVRESNPDSDFEPGPDGCCNAEANTYKTEDGYRVEWHLNAVGLITSVEFATLADAYDWLERNRFENLTPPDDSERESDR